VSNVKKVSYQAGFGTAMPENPASFLGSWEATPWQVATAYTIFPNDGVRYRPFLISEIRDKSNNVLYSTPALSYQAANTGSAWSVSKILKEVATTGTAASMKRLGFDKEAGGKTGTTNDFKDAWFAGYTSSLTCAVWVGFDTPKKTFQGGYGSALSLPIWVDIMKTADRLGYKAGDLHSEIDLVTVDLCRLSGKRATSGCHSANTAYNDKIPLANAPKPGDLCPIHPAKAQAVDEDHLPPHSLPHNDSNPPRALPINPGNSSPSNQPLRAEPVDENTPPRARPVEDAPPPRARPVQ
jgi:penicillin-binding protein 1A